MDSKNFLFSCIIVHLIVNLLNVSTLIFIQAKEENPSLLLHSNFTLIYSVQ